MHKIVEDLPPKLEIPHTPHLADFLSRCLQKDPRRRPRADQLLRHPWITTEKLPVPPNAAVPKTLSLMDLCVTAQQHEEEEEEDSDDDDSDEESDESETEVAAPRPVVKSVSAPADVPSEEEEEYTDEEDNLTEDQREIQGFHRQFDELILWLNRALDQQNKKQATRLCETIQGRDKPLRIKYGDHPDAKPLIDALNQVLSRYYKVSVHPSSPLSSLRFLVFSLSLLSFRRSKVQLSRLTSTKLKRTSVTTAERSHLSMIVMKRRVTTTTVLLHPWTCLVLPTSFGEFEK
jgi:serine/threonine protein kinase